MPAWLQDARFALRLAARAPLFTLVAIATIALGVGANTAVFSVVNGVLLTPLPYGEPEQLVRLAEERPAARQGIRGSFLSNYTYYAWRDASRALEGIAAYSSTAATVTDFGEAIRLQGTNVSANLFDILRVTPAAGRFFQAGEGEAGSAPVIVLSHRLWRDRFGADPAAIGRTITLDGKAHEIVGVTRPDFYFPTRDADYWTAYTVLAPPSDPRERAIMLFAALGRLRPDVTPDAAGAEGTGIAAGATRLVDDPIFGSEAPLTVRARSIVDEMTATVRPALMVISVAVAMTLLVACANLANLLLSRGVARQREMAIRGALGADALRLLRQMLTESVLLALAGGLAGTGLAWAIVRALPAIAPADFPRLDDVRLDGSVLGVALLLSLASGLVLGLAPAVFGARAGLIAALHGGAAAPLSGFSRSPSARLRSTLLIAEAALAVILLVGAGLLLRSFAKLTDTDVGYRPENLITAQLVLPRSLFTPDRSRALIDEVLERVRATPGVTAAGAGNMMPLARMAAIMAFRLPPAGASDEPVVARALIHRVTPEFGEALGLRLVDGRLLDARDRPGSTRALVVNDAFVRQYLGGRRAVGLTLPGIFDDDGVTEIVGVVADVKREGFDSESQPEMYLSYVQKPEGLDGGNIYLAIRGSGDPSSLAATLRSLVRQADATAALDNVASMSQRLAASVAQPRFAAFVLTAFAALTLALAAGGLYGVLAYSVAQRRAELGVRKALGAGNGDLVRLVLGQGLGLTAAGVAGGLLLSWWLARFASGLLFGVTATDPASYLGAAGAVFVVAAVACWLPARRAARVDAMDALRPE